MRNIVALVDLEEDMARHKALSTALEVARGTGARLHVLTIVPAEAFKMAGATRLMPDGYKGALIKKVRRRLAAFIGKHATDDVEVAQVVRFGSVYKEALLFARHVAADLIVMGAHKPRLRAYLLGSNAAQVVRQATCSVWVVRDESG